MSQSRLIALTYFDPGKSVRLIVYADAIYGGATIEMPWNGRTRQLKSVPKQYRRQMPHDGLYAVGTLMADDDPQPADALEGEEEPEVAGEQQTIQSRKCYIFVPAGDRDRPFEELGHSDITTTLNVYGHVLNGDMDRLGQVMDRLLF